MKIPALVSMMLAATLAWAVPGGDGTPLRGQVLETADGGAYVYLKLNTPQGEVWAATMKQPIPKGADIVIHDPMLMANFQSKALNRTFEQIVFGSVVSIENPSSATAAQGMAAHGMAAHKNAGATASNVPVEKIAKAPGANARTVDEVYAQRAQLNGKPVVLRGKVVKFSSDILDRNWAHLRDGSGVAANGSNDLLVTTKQTMKVGEVVTVSGMVKTNADYGSGYAYPVVLESATLQK